MPLGNQLLSLTPSCHYQSVYSGQQSVREYLLDTRVLGTAHQIVLQRNGAGKLLQALGVLLKISSEKSVIFVALNILCVYVRLSGCLLSVVLEEQARKQCNRAKYQKLHTLRRSRNLCASLKRYPKDLPSRIVPATYVTRALRARSTRLSRQTPAIGSHCGRAKTL